MLEQWLKFLCQIGWHNPELEYRSAPGVFLIDGKEVMIEGKVERCKRCPALFFSYKNWPRSECVEQHRHRPGATIGAPRPSRRFAIAA